MSQTCIVSKDYVVCQLIQKSNLLIGSLIYKLLDSLMNVTKQKKMATTSACQNTDFLRLRRYELFTSNETIILIYSFNNQVVSTASCVKGTINPGGSHKKYMGPGTIYFDVPFISTMSPL